ncbi:IS30 family transposase [Amphritea opalescens]|uniref:IS30 family transposase n=1 Tax=Amphritea opalescens TaxID=2490544 RepID=UPI00268634C1
MTYQQLIEGKRYRISILLAQGYRPAFIAKTINVHRSTVYRELDLNGSKDGYRPEPAQQKAQERRALATKYKIPALTVEYVELGLSLHWSPEQISGVGHLIDMPVSHEWIYRYIARGTLYKALRQGHKRYRRGVNTKRCVIPDPRSIDERPEVVEIENALAIGKSTVLCKQGTGALVTLAERKSRMYLVRKVAAKRATDVRDAVTDMLKPYAASVRTITADNGSEFVEHKAIADALNIDFYFAHPYSSWERGLNENFNGLLRQYIP